MQFIFLSWKKILLYTLLDHKSSWPEWWKQDRSGCLMSGRAVFCWFAPFVWIRFSWLQSQQEKNGNWKNDPSHPRACCGDWEAARANFNRPGPSSNKSNIHKDSFQMRQCCIYSFDATTYKKSITMALILEWNLFIYIIKVLSQL